MGQLGRIVELEDADLPALQALFERCSAFFQLVQGSPPRHDQAMSWLHQGVPEGAAPQSRTVYGLLDDEGRLVGAVDATRDHPAAGEWWIGTMILEPTIRGVGLGAGFHAEILRRVRQHGARGIQLCVQRENPGALRFWAREGYQETGISCVWSADRPSEVIRMRLEL
jgi:GNAT superfamily N-acetyltransferase